MERINVIRDDEARCVAALPDGVPDRIMVMPAGEIRTKPHDARAPWRMDDPAAVVAASAELRADLPIDYDHQTDFAKSNGQPAPAAGWIKGLEVEAEGVFARVEWTERAADSLRRRTRSGTR